MSLYTSRSEFDLEKRIQFTNEIPPYDMFGGLNSVLQTDLWKWVLGFTDVEFGLPYYIDMEVQDYTGTHIEKSHDAGIDSGEVYYKMVNGRVVDDVPYGPPPSDNKKYHRLEEYGVLLPEFDLLLHEVYRYLGSPYPDHPDMTELLTDNEFNDMVANAAAVIDYVPDVKFFDVVSQSLNLGNPTDERFESAMLKIRNLKNDGFRKRVYGSKMGYRMLTSDIFQNVSVFPVATYLPIKPVDKIKYKTEVGTTFMKRTSDNGEIKIISISDYNEEIDRLQKIVDENPADSREAIAAQNQLEDYNKYEPVSPMVDMEQLKQWNQKNGYSYDTTAYNNHIRQHNRVIDTYSKHYNRKFRLIDYDGSNSSYPEPKDKNKYAFGYTLPFNEQTMFEVPACTDTESMISEFDLSNELFTKDYDTLTNYIKGINTDIPLKTISCDYAANVSGGRITVKEQLVEEIHSVDTTLKNIVPYKNLYVYPPLKDTSLDADFYNAIKYSAQDFYKENANPKDDSLLSNKNFLTHYYSTYMEKGFTKDYLKNVIKPFPVIYNPLVEGTFYTTPSNTISFYPHSVTAEGYSGSQAEYFGNYYVLETPIIWDCIEQYSYLAVENLSELDTNAVGTTIQVTDFTKGYVDIKIDSDEASEKAQIFNVAESQRVDDSSGIVIENENGDLIVLEGKLTVTTILQAGRYMLTSEHFDIAAIPLEKTPNMMETLYPEYNSVVNQLKTSTHVDATKTGWTVRDYVDEFVNAGYDLQLARNYYSDDDNVYNIAKSQIMESDIDYTPFLKYVKELIGYEEQIATWKKNSANLYKTIKYTIDGEEFETEQTLVQPGCKVVMILKGSNANILEGIPDTIPKDVVQEDGTVVQVYVPNEAKYQKNVVYGELGQASGYLTGDISSISLGNLNAITIYNNLGQAEQGQEVRVSRVKLTSPNKESCNFSYLTAVEDYVRHDDALITDYTFNTVKVKNMYKQSLSVLDQGIVNYMMGKADDGYLNLWAVPIDHEVIQIESVIDISHEGCENIIFFESDAAREMFKSLSVGDVVTGPSIDSDDNDVYITHIGDFEVTVNVKLQQSGTFLLSYLVKTNVNPKDITNNLLQYKEDLYINGLYSVKNPFEHGLWPSQDYPNVSTAILDSLPDISFYEIYNYRTENSNSFTKILEDTHYEDYTALVEESKNGTLEKYLMPSDIKFNNELFLELNLNKLLYYPTQKSNKTPVLMSVKWLDYIENSLMYSSRSTDNVNVGVNVMLETDTTGYYTLIPDNPYTDPQIRLKFITLNLNGQNMWPEKGLGDDDWTIPCYAQVGNGGEGRRSWFKSPDDVKYPNVWGIHVYDDVKDPADFDEDSEFYKNGGELRNVSLYGQDSSEAISYVNTVKYTDVESPLFEIPLGEYDTVTKYVQNNKNTSKNLLSITQASFYSQTFTNIMKYFSGDGDEKAVKIIGNGFADNNILESCFEKKPFIYAGVWTPTKEPHYDKNNELTNYYEVVYPENPSDYQYYVVTDDINLSNIVILDKDNNITGQETRAFLRADILFRYNGQWYVKNFQYLGLVGDGFDVVITNADKSFRRMHISPELNKSLNQTGINNLTGEDGKVYYYTFKERLVQYYLRAANTQSPAYYNTVICNTGFGDKRYYMNSDDDGINLETVLKDFPGIKKMHKDKVLYWIYAGTFDPGDGYEKYWKGEKNRNWLDEDENVDGEHNGHKYSEFFQVGDRIALVNFDPDYSEEGSKTGDNENADWFIFKINTKSILGMSLPISLWRSVEASEYDVILDRCSYLNKDSYCGINTLLGNINSEINLPRGYITEGSYNFNIAIDPHFISKGYKYLDDGMTIDKSKEVEFCTTKGAIYFDSRNNAFYTFSNIVTDDKDTLSDDVYKVAVKFNEQKFFKNTLKVPCVYQIKNALVTGEQTVKQTPVLTSIDGLDFPLDKLSVGDRLLEVRELKLRSTYSNSLEPVFFSNYFNVNYPIKGITENHELYLSSIPSNPLNDTEKYNFAIDVMNLAPVVNEFDEDTKSYKSTLATTKKELELGDEYGTPKLSKISITKPLLTDDFSSSNNTDVSFVNKEFGYFKNNLIVRGKIDSRNPRTIVTPVSDGSMFKAAVENISMGDTLVGAYALEPTGNEEKFQINITVNGQKQDNAKIQYAYFANGQFRAVTKDGVVYFNDDIDVANVTSSIECKKSIIFDKVENKRFQGDVVMVGWTKDLGWYVEINLENKTSVICSLDLLNSTDNNENNVCNLSQAYMSNGSHVYVDYNDEDGVPQHTLVAHTLHEYDKDYLTPRTLTVSYNNTTEGLQIMNENTEISTDISGNTVWETKVYNGDNVDYTVKVTIERVEEFIKAIITDKDSLEEILVNFDGNFGTSDVYNIEKISTTGDTLEYVIYEPESNGKLIEITNNGNGTSDYHVHDAKVYITEDASIWKEYSYDGSNNRYTYEKSDTLLPELTEKAVISGLGKQYNYKSDGTGENEDIKILYRDIALSSAKLTKDSDENVYNIGNDFISEPYFVDTAMAVNSDGSKIPVSNSLMSRSVLKKDNSGKYEAYAKGRSLFIKSPTSLLEKTKNNELGLGNGYAYSGFLTTESFWKHANAPIFNEKMFLTIRSTLVNDKRSVDELVELSMLRTLELLGHQVNLSTNQTAGITVDGRPISIDYDNELFGKLKEVFSKISGYTGKYTDDDIEFTNKVTYEKLVNAVDKAKKDMPKLGDKWVKVDNESNVVGTPDGYPLVVRYDGKKWIFRCYGFKLVEETITDGLSVIGASKQTFAELPPSVGEIGNYYTQFELLDDAVEPNYEHAYATFAYYYTYYLCGNGENTDIILSSDISDIQFTDSNMLVTDAKGNVSSIGLCYLHNKNDIENPEHWNVSTFPNELTCYSIEHDIVGKANYKVGSNYLSIPRPEVLTRQNTFKVECSYANEEIILYGGYIYSRNDIEKIYDDFFRGDKTEAEYADWKDKRSEEDKQVLESLLKKSKFSDVGTPVLLYSTDKGITFNMTSLKSTQGKSFDWESDEEPNTTTYVSAIVFADGEYKVFVRDFGNTDNLEYYYYFEQNDDGLFDFAETTGTKDMDEYGDISNAHEFDIDSTTGTNDFETPSRLPSNNSQLNTIPSGFYRMMFTEGDNCFYILSTKAVNFGANVFVQSKTSNSITVSSALVKDGTSEFDVLLSFDTRNNIKDAFEYLNMERAQKYVNNLGNLYVPEVTMVDDSVKANRFYSYRELLNADSLDVSKKDSYDPYGYPSVLEDVEQTMYEYDDLYDSEKGEFIKIPKYMVNGAGDIIYLCDYTGKNYVYVDKNTNQRMLGTLEMRGSNSIEMFQPAFQPVYKTLGDAEENPTIRKTDDNFIGKLNLTDSNITGFSYDSDKPYVRVSTQNSALVKDVADYIFSEDETKEFVEYLRSTTTLLRNQLNDIDLDNEAAALTQINNIMYDTGRIENGNSVYAPRFILKNCFNTQEASTSTYADGQTETNEVNVVHRFWFDNATQIYPLKKKRFLSALAFIPYCFNAGITAYNNIGFDDIKESKNSILPTPVTGVYLSNYGYGGSRDNSTFWENTVPWLVDPDAFVLGEYLKNSIGEPVYMVDAGGNVLQSYDAEESVQVGDTIRINCRFMAGNAEKDLYVYSNSDNVYKHKILQLEEGEVSIYTPVKELSLGNTPFELSLWAYQSFRLVDIDKTTGTGSPKISFKYYGKISKTDWAYVPCGDGTENDDTVDFYYDELTKRICYKGAKVLKKRFGDSPVVSELLVTFYVNERKYELRYAINFNDAVSMPSIYFDAFAIYRKSDKYDLVKMGLGKLNTIKFQDYVNSSDINLTVSKSNGNGGYDAQSISIVDASSDTILGSIYDGQAKNISGTSAGCLRFSLQPTFDNMNNTVKIQAGGTLGDTLTINLPLFILGKIRTTEDYIYETNTNGYWVWKTYIDNLCLDDSSIDNLTVEYKDGTVILKKEDLTKRRSSTKGPTEEDEVVVTMPIGKLKGTKPDFDNLGYYLNFPNGSVFRNVSNSSLKVEVIRIDENLPDNVYINGAYGKLICRKPVYNSFQELINDKGFIINRNDTTPLYSGDKSSTITINMSNTNDRSFSLTEFLDIAGLNDGEKHYILMKWLTQATIKTEIGNCNNDSEFIEIDMDDKTKFPPDRIWFNPDGYPVPPVVIGNSIFNSENNEQYSGESYKNNNGYSIYRCNEKGHLVGYAMMTDPLSISKYDTNSDGIPDDVEGYIQNEAGGIESIAVEFELDPHNNRLADAQIPKKPNYDTCQDWFKDEFFIKGHESNPYWQILNISSFFNKNHVWEQRMTVNEYVRSTQEMIMSEVAEEDRYVVPRNTIMLSTKNDTCTITPNADPVNKVAGLINFVLDKPATKYQTEKQFIKYGITAKNPFYGNDVWNGKDLGLSGYLDSTYTVCSTKNLADPRDKDSEVQEVTEFGLFNKYHQLIAYAVFPPIEYRTSTQHLSFTAYVKQGSCVDPHDL